MSTERFAVFVDCVLLLGTRLRKHGLRKTCWNTCTVVYSIDDACLNHFKLLVDRYSRDTHVYGCDR